VINIDNLIDFVKPYYENKDIMHNLSHIDRGLNYVKKLIKVYDWRRKTYLIVKSLITGSVRGQTLEQTIRYIEDNILGKGICYLAEAQGIYFQQQEFAKDFIYDLSNKNFQFLKGVRSQ